jgi:hypothetical protein
LHTSKILRAIVVVDSLLMAFGHAYLSLFLRQFFMMGTTTRPPPSGSPSMLFLALGGYFLFAVIIYVLGAILVAAGKLFKLANLGLIIMALVDNALLLYTRTMPNIFFGRILGWSWDWFPRLGTVQVLVGQTLLIVLCALLYRSSRKGT